MIVYLLSKEQKKILEGKCYDNSTFFNPIQDTDDNWIITEEEVKCIESTELEWVKSLQKIDYKAKENILTFLN